MAYFTCNGLSEHAITAHLRVRVRSRTFKTRHASAWPTAECHARPARAPWHAFPCSSVLQHAIAAHSHVQVGSRTLEQTTAQYRLSAPCKPARAPVVCVSMVEITGARTSKHHDTFATWHCQWHVKSQHVARVGYAHAPSNKHDSGAPPTVECRAHSLRRHHRTLSVRNTHAGARTSQHLVTYECGRSCAP